MPALFLFLLKVNVALIIFCLGYYLVLRRLTFYTLNRLYLFIAIIFSSVYPLININSFVQHHNIPVQNVIVNWKVPVEAFVKPIVEQPNYWYWAEMIFWAGAAMLTVRLFIQLLSLYKLYKNSAPANIQEHEVRIVKADISPFSFWQSIYINPENLNPADLKSILQHEQVHIKEWHTLDILLTEISVIFYWFNPGIWLMKRAVRENIEFITDRKILQKGTDSKAYQYSLLNVSFSATTSAGITNHFNFSTLKKRIQMMNAKRSSNVNLTRYAFLVPAVVVLLLLFSFSKAELVKKSKIVYKTITTSVSSLKQLPQTAYATIAVKKTTAKVKVADTIKKTATVTVIFHAKDKNDSIKTYSFTSANKTDSNRIHTFKKGNPSDSSVTFIIDGKVAKKSDFEHIDPHDIDRFSVVKSDNGVILVETKKKDPDTHYFYSNDGGVDKVHMYKVVVKGSYDPGNKASGNTGVNNFSDALIFIDGKEASEKDMKKLPASDIQGIEVKKDSKETTDKYGDKAKKGVIFITTKKGNKTN